MASSGDQTKTEETKKKFMTDEEKIAQYKMKEGDYRIIIKLLEASDLIPTANLFGKKKSTVTPIVKIECCGKTSYSKKIKQKTCNPIFNQQFFYDLKEMKQHKLENSTINFTVIDYSPLRDNIVGSYEIDLSVVYFQLNHEVYQGWLTLTDPTDEREGIMGYLKVSISVCGPGDEPVVHDIKQEKKSQAKEKSFFGEKVRVVGHLISVDLYRAEHLAPVDKYSQTSDAYVRLKYSGIKTQTKQVKSMNPEWNQNIHIATNLPNVSKYIQFEVYDSKFIDEDELIGQFKLRFKDIQEKDYPPQWGNLYGPPLSHITKGDIQMGQLMAYYGDTQGSHYRGRILYKITSWGEKDPQTRVKDLKFQFPYNPIPTGAQKNYLLRVNILQTNEVPEREKCIIHVAIGPYLLKSNEFKIDQGRAIIFQQLEDKKVLFPVNVEEIPDLFIYFADKNEEFRRHSFARIKAKDILIDDKIYEDKDELKKRTRAKNIKLKEDRSLNLISDEEIPGYVYAGVQLWTVSPDPVVSIKAEDIPYENYYLRVFVYVGRNFAPKDSSGTSDPFVIIRCAGQTAATKCMKETLNPGWYETIQLDVKLPKFEEGKDMIIEPGYSLSLYDSDAPDNEKEYQIKRDLIGRAWVQIQNNFAFYKHMGKQDAKSTNFLSQGDEYIDFIYNKPKWYNIIYEPTEELQGKILVSCALFKKELPDGTDAIHKIPKLDASIKPSCDKRKLYMYIIGLRDIIDDCGDFKPRNLYVRFSISQQSFNDKEEFETNKTRTLKIKEGGINLKQPLKIDIDVPRNKKLHPVLEIQVWDEPQTGGRRLLGIGTIEFTEHLQKYIDEQKDEDDNEEEYDKDLIQLIQDGSNQNKGQKKQEALKGQKLDKTTIGKADQTNITKQSVQFQDDSLEINVPWELPRRKLILDKKDFDQQVNNLPQDNEQEIEEQDEEEEEDEKVDQGQDQKGNNQRQNFESYQSLDQLLEDFNEEEHENLLQKSQNNGKSQLKSNQYNNSNTKGGLVQQAHVKQQNQINAKNNVDDSQLVNLKDSFIEDEKNDIKDKLNGVAQNKIQDNQQKLQNNSNNQGIQLGKLVESQIKSGAQQSALEIKSQAPTNAEKEKVLAWYEYKDNKKVYENFQILSKNSISFERDPSDHAIPYQDNINQETDEGRRKRLRDQQKAKKKKGFFMFNNKKMKKKQKQGEQETYEDFDTDPGEDLDLTQEFLKDRPEFKTDLEQQFEKNNVIKKFPIKRGLQRGKNNLFKVDRIQEIVEVTNLKCIFLKEAKEEKMTKNYQMIDKIMNEKDFIVRLYVLRGRNILGNGESDPDCYLKVRMGEQEISDKELSLRKASLNPYFYRDYEFKTQLPGNSYLKVEVWDQNDFDVDQMIGFTNIDLEERFFQTKWKQMDKKPIENRNIQSMTGSVSCGHLEMWIDIILKSKIKMFPKIKIEPPPYDEYEIRVIVHSTKDLVYKDVLDKCNDVFCGGAVGNMDFQETDIHWRCRSKGSFNWRWKYKVKYPMREEDYGNGMDRFRIQVWDKDIIGSNELIGEAEIDLNLHKMIDKACKRKKPVQMYRKILEQGSTISDKFWFDLYTSDAVDPNGKKISQGKVQLSFELLPIEEAEKKQNGTGRDAPNNYPPLAEPTGRFQFNLMDPCGMIKEIIGPDLYNKCFKFTMYVLCMSLFIFLLIMVFPNIIAVKIGNI